MGTDVHAGRLLCADEVRDQSDVSASKEGQRLPAHHQKLGKGLE